MPYTKRMKGKAKKAGGNIPSLSDARKRVAGHMKLSNAAYMRHEKSFKVKSVGGGKVKTKY